ncbi:MAG: CoA-binding protein [Deltaproteobacteria bacterium]|nr:CoA-binding protein [Deltaproteobacteria bacterium]
MVYNLNNIQESKSDDSLARLFYPGAVAVVGISLARQYPNRFFLDSMKELGFPGPIYVVNSKGENIGEFPGYKSLNDIPGSVDHVIIAVSAGSVFPVFASGFSEYGQAQGKQLENEIRDWVKNQSFRLIGPNCMGLYCPESGLGFRRDFPSEAGTIGFVSQSGGMATSGVLLGSRKGLRFSKVVSYGNEADITSAELLRYLAHDSKTDLVWAYLEGTDNGLELVKAMEEVSRKKPLLVLKGGTTKSGSRAVSSHTGAMAGSHEIWEAALKGARTVRINNLEELIETTLAIQKLPPKQGIRLGIACVSGGLSVNYTDQAIRAGFQVPSFSGSLISNLMDGNTTPGTSMNNPLDMAINFFNHQAYQKIFTAMDLSGEIDILVLVLALEYVLPIEERSPGHSMVLVQAFLKAALKVEHPFLVIIPPIMDNDIARVIMRMFMKEGIPVFTNMESALKALSRRRKYISQIS